VIFVITATRHR